MYLIDICNITRFYFFVNFFVKFQISMFSQISVDNLEKMTTIYNIEKYATLLKNTLAALMILFIFGFKSSSKSTAKKALISDMKFLTVQ